MMEQGERVDHDRLFKQLLTTFFAEFIELFLPEVAAYLDRGSIVFLDKEVFTDLTAGERHEVDILARARFRDREAFFLLHVENQATAREQFARRMFRYFARLDETHDLPVYPIALFSYDAPRRAEPDRYRVEFPDKVVLDFSFRVIQLNRLNWRDFLRHPNPVAAALMTKMRIPPGDRPRLQLEILRLIATLKLDKARQSLIREFMVTYLRLSAAEAVAYHKELTTLDPPEQEAVMQIVDQWEERGLRRGKADVILRQLRRRFGQIPAELESHVRNLSEANLDELAEALLDFAELARAEAWVKSRA